jgi:uncharacterized membrane protein
MWPLLTQSYWRDEAFSVMLASRPLKDIFNLIVKFEHAPPLVAYLQHFWIGLFGTGEFQVRSLSFLFHLLTVFFVYKLSKSRLAALAVGFNPFLWIYAWEVRQYGVYGAIVLGAVYFHSIGKIWPSVIFWSLALLSHNFAWLYFGTFLFLTRDKRLLPVLVTGFAWLPWLWQQVNRVGQGMWLELPSGWLWWWDSLKIFLTSGFSYPIKPLLLGLSLILLIPGVLKRGRLVWLALLPPVEIYVISRLWEPLYLERYLIPTVPLLIVAIGMNLKRIKLVKFLAVAYILAAAIAIIQISRQETKPPMRQAVNQIVQKLEPEEIIVTEQPINYLEVYFYLQQSGNQDKLYSCLYPGEDHIPYYVGTDLIKPWQEIVAIPQTRPTWLVKPDASVLKYL